MVQILTAKIKTNKNIFNILFGDYKKGFSFAPAFRGENLEEGREREKNKKFIENIED